MFAGTPGCSGARSRALPPIHVLMWSASFHPMRLPVAAASHAQPGQGGRHELGLPVIDLKPRSPNSWKR